VLAYAGRPLFQKDIPLMRLTIPALAAVMLAVFPPAASADDGVLTIESIHSGEETVERLEAAIESRGFMVFARLDHAAAAEAVGLSMPFSTVVVFGNPKLGTPAFVQTPQLAIDLPLKALVWEDGEGDVFLSYNSSAYMYETIYERHGQPYPEAMVERLAGGLAAMTAEAAGN
jgi:uncharacterized protein (DUF302 family)